MKKIFSLLVKPDALDRYLPEQMRQWYVLQIFNLYRICIVSNLSLLYYFNKGILSYIKGGSELVSLVLLLYFSFAITSYYVAYRRISSVTVQAIVQVFFDITVFSLLIWSNKEFIYGYGILINAAIAGGSLITAGRISLLFAAYGSIAVLVQNIFSDPNNFFSRTGYTGTGILGATFFATAILGYGLSYRVRMSEALASQRGIDLAKLEKVNELIIQRMRSGVLVIDENDRVRFMNQAAWYLLRIPHREGPQFIGELSPELSVLLHEWQSNPVDHVPTSHTSISGHGLITQFTPVGAPAKQTKFATLVFLEDAAHLGQQAQQIKLASLGRLTASIAHEIRNPLSAISHAGQLLAESTKITDKERRLTEIIGKQSARLNDVIENILQLSRRKQAAPTLLPIKLWLTDFVNHFKMSLQTKNSISIYVEPDNLVIFADASQLQQILNNLCENGLKYSANGEQLPPLEIKAGIVSNTDEPFIEVIDHGKGIDKDIVDFIFEPFFTTKAGGTGLGLYIAKELCEANQAHISYHRIEQGGSCFRITFRHPLTFGTVE